MFSYLQRIGKALMVPVAILPAAAILLGIGYKLDPTGWGANSVLAMVLIKSGASIIDHMPILFAVGVAFGMSKDKNGSAALNGLVGFLVITTLLSKECAPTLLPKGYSTVGFEKIDNQFIGILVGVISSALYNRFSGVELPKALSFFSGKRLVPIITSFVMMAVSGILLFIWPTVYQGLINFGIAVSSMGAIGAGIYGFFNRLLIPVGLHHALNSVFWFDVANINDIPNFLKGHGVLGVTGRYQAGFFPVMMFGLPGAALAFVMTSKSKNKNKIASIMLAAAVTSFLTGVTEPLEFSFMFVAPVLYLIHAILTGISLFIAAKMQWIAGFGFSGGLIDLLLSWKNPLANKPYMLIVQGIVFFFLYFFIFSAVIKLFNLKTPGREDDENQKEVLSKEELVKRLIPLLGGKENIVVVDNCITRLRLEVKDNDIIDEVPIKKISSGVIKAGKNSIQIIIGTEVEFVAQELKEQLK